METFEYGDGGSMLALLACDRLLFAALRAVPDAVVDTARCPCDPHCRR